MAVLEDGHPLGREAGDLKDGEESLCWRAGRSLPRRGVWTIPRAHGSPKAENIRAHTLTLSPLTLPILLLQLKVTFSTSPSGHRGWTDRKDTVSSRALAITRFSIICRCSDRV